MPTDLDNQSVIIALTNGVGVHLGKRARASFFELARRLPRVDAFGELDHAAQQQVLDILAVAIFYSVVVFPLEAGADFMNIARAAGASHVRMGGDKLTEQFGSSMRRAVTAFYSIVNACRIPVDALSFATLSEFVNKVIAAGYERECETLDRQTDPGDPGRRIR